MDYFSHEPEIRTFAFAEASYSLEEIEVYAVSSVKADAVYFEFLYPVVDSIYKVVANAYIAEVEFNEIIVTIPALVPEWVAAW